MDLNKVGDKLQNKLYRDAYRKLVRILRGIDLPLDFTKTLIENEYEIEQAFKPAYDFILSFLETVALTSVNFSRLQLKEINNKVSVKSTDVEIIVNWVGVDQSVVDFLQRGDSFATPHADIVTAAIANGNRSRLQDEYIAYIRGEKTLQDAYNFLRNGVCGSQRANLIVRSEMTEVWAIAQQESYRTAGTISNIWNTRNDGKRVCPICAPLNGLKAVIGQPFPGTRITRPGAHLGCRCWLSPSPMTDEEIIEFIETGTNKPNISEINFSPKMKKEMEDKVSEKAVFVNDINSITDLKTYLESIKLKYPTNGLYDEVDKLSDHVLKLNNRIYEATKATNVIEESKTAPYVDFRKALDLENELKKEKQLTIDKIKSTRDKINDVENEHLQKQREALYTKNPSNVQTNIADSLKTSSSLQDGIREFNRMIPDNKKLANVVFNFDEDATGRAGYYYQNGRIKVSHDENISVVVHEMIHRWEDYDPAVDKLAKKFFDRRTKGESYEKLVDLYPGYNYREDEVTKKDKFIDAYMGKKNNVGSEILTMGIQRLWENPGKFLQDDPDYFNFIVKDVLKRVDSD